MATEGVFTPGKVANAPDQALPQPAGSYLPAHLCPRGPESHWGGHQRWEEREKGEQTFLKGKKGEQAEVIPTRSSGGGPWGPVIPPLSSSREVEG